MTESLAPGQVRVRLALVGEQDFPAERYLGLIDPEERARHDRFATDALRREFLVTRALARTTLSGFAKVDPRDWRFLAGPYGRPEILEPIEHRDIRFNLSNTRGLVACAVTLQPEVGVDVEWTPRSVELEDVARSHFAPEELSELLGLLPELRRSRFFDYWTLKEAYIKARGLGLQIPLEQFSFRLGNPIQVSIDPRLGDVERTWSFRLGSPTPAHRLALAVRTDGPIEVREDFVVP
jgi:4'-phosphopantetheinyl transferase